jgi:hypothetical protein
MLIATITQLAKSHVNHKSLQARMLQDWLVILNSQRKKLKQALIMPIQEIERPNVNNKNLNAKMDQYFRMI